MDNTGAAPKGGAPLFATSQKPKHEIRSSKSETNSKHQIQNKDQTTEFGPWCLKFGASLSLVLVCYLVLVIWNFGPPAAGVWSIRIWLFVSDFKIRDSDFAIGTIRESSHPATPYLAFPSRASTASASLNSLKALS